MKHLVVGCGEVGKALMSVLGCDGYDPQAGYYVDDFERCEMLHVCIPYSDTRPENLSANVAWQSFKEWVLDYQQQFNSSITVIHSTVPIGTSDSLGANHSPVRGRHPHLAESLRTFLKYVGGPEAGKICDEFRQFAIPCVPLPRARDIEAGKLLDLMQFGASIVLEKEIHQFCLEHGVDFETVYSSFNQTYTDGYAAMGERHHARPVLKHHAGPISGHCVVQNMKYVPSPTAEAILEFNRRLQESVSEVVK